ncbi:hypothetical protein CEUSTIGMA_g8696.t1 [Chlamydomonas eustigma]|uniref:Uncharacterized protein n=1 Tax=Chlamydomonas eustigma TaxID=1157962 RepID=A0A250XDW7_9CHLO|nr:hypothetical protein CEUSTIGMA_g8696.t1 [Chlamydomonas eustigma]|eukprot:GAX81264.1 hypothetical protein CEUSTIGMA_g8696.t1 [Chlamydomonas eustigma]
MCLLSTKHPAECPHMELCPITFPTQSSTMNAVINADNTIAPLQKKVLTCPVVGASLPRTVRGRLDANRKHPRRVMAHCGKTESPFLTLDAYAWVECEGPVLYSDSCGIFHVSLTDQQELLHNSAGSSPANISGDATTASMPSYYRALARKEHSQRREVKISALWEASRHGAKNRRSTHNIQQARPRAFSR